MFRPAGPDGPINLDQKFAFGPDGPDLWILLLLIWYTLGHKTSVK